MPKPITVRTPLVHLATAGNALALAADAFGTRGATAGQQICERLMTRIDNLSRLEREAMTVSEVSALASLAGPVLLRGYRFTGGSLREFAVTDGGWAWVDDGEGGVSRQPFSPQTWDWYEV